MNNIVKRRQNMWMSTVEDKYNYYCYCKNQLSNPFHLSNMTTMQTADMKRYCIEYEEEQKK